MEKLLEHMIVGITNSKDYSVIKTEDDSTPNNHINFEIKASPEIIGIIIGKEGKTVRAIRNLLRVRATLDKIAVSLSVTEKE